jgi:NAD-dependent dihydropyrimidine dehydrogenase PreA subunit
MQLEIVKYRHKGGLEERDCLKCSSCITACPRKNILSWPDKKQPD